MRIHFHSPTLTVVTTVGSHSERLDSFLREESGPRSADEVRAGLGRAGVRIGLATVYRLLKRGVESGAYTSVALPDGGLRYEPADRGHHHHFHCAACDRVFDVEGCPGRFAALVPEGFALDDHDVLLHGRCRDCVQGEAA